MLKNENFSVSLDMTMPSMIVAGGSQLSLSAPSVINQFDDDDIVIRAKFSLYCAPYNSSYPVYAELYYQETSGSSLELIDRGEVISNGAIFDISKLIYLKKYKTGNLIIKNLSSYGLRVYKNGHTLNVDYHKEGTIYQTECVTSKDINDTASFSFDFVLNRLLLKKSIYNGLLKANISINYNKNFSTYYVFPKWWRLNVLEELIIHRTNNFSGSVVSIDYVDREGVIHYFEKADNSSDLYYSTDGTRMLIKEYDISNQPISAAFFELFTEYSNAKKYFGYFGDIMRSEDGNGNYLTYSLNSFNALNITDNLSNVIKVTKDASGNLSIKLNNSFEYFLTVDSNGVLTSISYNGKTDTIAYDTNENLTDYLTDDGNEVSFSYTNNRITNIETSHNSNTLENDSLEYDYLKTVITNRHNVKTFYIIDENLTICNSGEVVNQEENRLFIHSKKLLNSDLVTSINKSDDFRVYINGNGNSSFQLSTSYPSLSITSCTSMDSNNPYLLKEGGRYLLFAALQKTTDYPLNDNRKVIIKLLNGTSEVTRIDFEPLFDKQNAVIDFISPIDETSNNKLKIQIDCTGLGIIGNVYVRNIYIIELKEGKRNAYYSTKPSSSFITDTTNPISIDNNNWYEFLTPLDQSGVIYSYDDLIHNYISVVKNTHLIWSDDGHHLSYNDDIDQLGNHFTYYSLRSHVNVVGSNAMFAKKTWIKYYWVGSTRKEVFDFSYVFEDNGAIKVANIRVVGNQSFKSEKTYDDIFNLISETNDDGDYTNSTYSTGTNILLSSTNGNSNVTETRSKSYSYDSSGRLSSISTTENSLTTSTSYTYDSNYELLLSSVDEYLNAEEYTYDSFKEDVVQIEKGLVSISRSFTNNLLVFSNDSEFQYAFDSQIEETKFKIKTGTQNNENVYIDLITYTQSYENDYDYVYKHYSSSNILRYKYDKYSHLVEIANSTDGTNYQVLAKHYYFDPQQGIADLIDAYNESTFQTCLNNHSFTSGINSRLTKSFEYDVFQVLRRVTDYRYYTNGNLYQVITKKAIQNNNLISDIIYSYDQLNRISSISYSFNGETYIKSITYQSDFNDSITYIYYQKDGDNSVGASQSIEYDELKRISSVRSGSKKMSFNYSSLSTGLNQIIINPLDVPAITHGLSYFNKVGNAYQHIQSKMVSYDKRGNVLLCGNSFNNQLVLSSSNLYSYDINDQLTKEINVDFGQSITYEYDNNGNITSATYRDNATSTLIKTDSYSYDPYYKDKLVSFNNKTIYYDSDLNISAVGNDYSMNWDKDHQLIYFYQGIDITSFEYNSNGIRISKNGYYGLHNYFLEGDNIFAETITKNNVTSSIIYLYGIDGVFGFIYNDQVYTYKKNIFGDVIAICSGINEVAHYKYDAYGNHKVYDSNGVEIDNNYSNYETNPGFVNPFRYRCYYYDVETGLYYCKHRYYSPSLRRWLSIDDEKYFDANNLLGTNLYAYCMNNPVKYSDPEGKFCLLAAILIGAIIGAVSGAAFGALTAVTQGETGEQVFFSAAIGFLTGAIMGAFAGAASHVVVTVGSYFLATSLNTVGGIVSSGLNDALNQIRQHGFIIDQESIGWSILQGGVIAFLSSPSTFLSMNNEPFLNYLAWDFMSNFPFDMISYTIDMLRWKKK